MSGGVNILDTGSHLSLLPYSHNSHSTSYTMALKHIISYSVPES